MGDHTDVDLTTSTWPGADGLPAVVLLHGSGQDETSLLPFARAAFPGRTLVAVRGRIPWENGFAHFRRRPDRTLDEGDLALGAEALHHLLARLHAEAWLPPLLCGYSNGAVVAAAAVLLDPQLTSGAILLRPLSPWPHREFGALDHYPVLLAAASYDERRMPGDCSALQDQLSRAGARVDSQTLPVGHGLTPADEALVRRWVPTSASTDGASRVTTAGPVLPRNPAGRRPRRVRCRPGQPGAGGDLGGVVSEGGADGGAVGGNEGSPAGSTTRMGR